MRILNGNIIEYVGDISIIVGIYNNRDLTEYIKTLWCHQTWLENLLELNVLVGKSSISRG
jgi:carbohydrate-selective porin OprB